MPLYYNGKYPGGFDSFLTRFTWNIGLTFLFIPGFIIILGAAYY
ncbi:hypothetical protein [Methanobacterium subterraneum]|nr:hypothetical protein [Methanobacterium subterraneum]